MKTKFIIASLFLFCLISCKDEKTEQSKEPAVQAVSESNIFKVTLDVSLLKDDNIHLYYTVDGSILFTEENSLWSEIKGSEGSQKIEFALPENVIPTAIRLDLGYGKNPDQSDVELKGFKMSFNDAIIEAQGPQVFDYFQPALDTSKRIEGTNKLAKLDKTQVSGPKLYPNDNLLSKIKQITTGIK